MFHSVSMYGLFYAPRTKTFSQDSPTWIQTEKRQSPGILRALDRIRWAFAKEELRCGLPPPPNHLRPWIASNHLIDLIQQRFNLGAALKIRSFHLQLVGDWWENKWMQSYKYTICITNHEFHCGWNYIWFIWLISVCWWKFSDTLGKFLQIGKARVRLLHDAVWTKASLRHRLRVGCLLWGWQCQHLCLAFALGFGLPTTLKQFHKVVISQSIDADGSGLFFPNAWFLSWFVEVKQRHGESHYSEISWDLWAKRLNRLAKHGKATRNHPSISQHYYNLRLFVLPYRPVFSYCVQHQHCQEEEHQIMCNVYLYILY